MSDYALLRDDSVAICISKQEQTQSLASFVHGRRPLSSALVKVLAPLPPKSEVVAALIPAYNEDAVDALTTVRFIAILSPDLPYLVTT